jgi:hypothetical protein
VSAWQVARRALVALALVAGAGALATGRAVADGEASLYEADAALRRQSFPEATARARTSASWYVPGAPHVPAAYARLLHIARTSEAAGDRDAALFAWQAMRSAALESRWVVQPHRRELDMADAAIARLMSESPRPVLSRDQTAEQAERSMLAQLSAHGASRAPWIGALLAGLALACGGALAAARLGVAPDGAILWDRVRVPFLVATAGLVLYGAAVWQA